MFHSKNASIINDADQKGYNANAESPKRLETNYGFTRWDKTGPINIWYCSDNQINNESHFYGGINEPKFTVKLYKKHILI